MVTMPVKMQSRIANGIKKFQPIIIAAKNKDVNESDTVVVITDMLHDIFGYDKYTEITSEYNIKKTFCDLAIKVEGKLRLLIECKAIGIELKDDHIKQAIDYGANAGIDWVILTNGLKWKIYKILFAKPIEKELVYEFDVTALNIKKNADMELLYYISKEALTKSVLDDYHTQKQALSKFFIGQILTTDIVVDAINKVLKKVTPDIKINNEDIQMVLTDEVIKRDVFEGEKSLEAKKKIARMNKAEIKTKNVEKIVNKDAETIKLEG